MSGRDAADDPATKRATKPLLNVLDTGQSKFVAAADPSVERALATSGRSRAAVTSTDEFPVSGLRQWKKDYDGPIAAIRGATATVSSFWVPIKVLFSFERPREDEKTLDKPGVLYDSSGLRRLEEELKKYLDSALNRCMKGAKQTIKFEGHCSAEGPAAINDPLSGRRAQALKDWVSAWLRDNAKEKDFDLTEVVGLGAKSSKPYVVSDRYALMRIGLERDTHFSVNVKWARAGNDAPVAIHVSSDNTYAFGNGENLDGLAFYKTDPWIKQCVAKARTPLGELMNAAEPKPPPKGKDPDPVWSALKSFADYLDTLKP